MAYSPILKLVLRRFVAGIADTARLAVERVRIVIKER